MSGTNNLLHVARAGLQTAKKAWRRVVDPNTSWYWPILDRYRDARGRTLAEVETEFFRRSPAFSTPAEAEAAIRRRDWCASPMNETRVKALLHLLECHFNRDEEFQYLEFGCCYGTTLASVLHHFPNAQGIGYEIMPPRYDIARFLLENLPSEWSISERVELHHASVTEGAFDKNSIDVVLMDTDHVYEREKELVEFILTSGMLRPGFLFVGDDPLHTGTHLMRLEFIKGNSATYRIVTQPEWNLWWFTQRPKTFFTEPPSFPSSR